MSSPEHNLRGHSTDAALKCEQRRGEQKARHRAASAASRFVFLWRVLEGTSFAPYSRHNNAAEQACHLAHATGRRLCRTEIKYVHLIGALSTGR